MREPDPSDPLDHRRTGKPSADPPALKLRFWAEPFALMAGRVGDPGPDAIVQALVANEATRPIGLRALINAQRLEPHTIVEVVASLSDWRDRRRVFEALIERVPETEVVSLLRDLARCTSEGNDLFFLHLVLERLGERGSGLARDAVAARAQLFDHLEPSAAAMKGAFATVTGRPQHAAFCAIAPGVFEMGDEQAGRVPGIVIAEPFWIGATPVTVGQYRLFDPTHRSTMEGRTTPVVVDSPTEQRRCDAFPVVGVTWFASVSFTRWLTRWQDRLPRTGAGLPPGALVAALASEAQWEYAARAGTTSRFWFGDRDEDVRRHGRAGEEWESGPFPVGTASAGGKAEPSVWGLLDVHGGVWEWCASLYEGDRRREHVEVDTSASPRVLRGGSFGDRPGSCRSACRLRSRPAFAGGDGGFRVVLAARPQLGSAIDLRS